MGNETISKNTLAGRSRNLPIATVLIAVISLVSACASTDTMSGASAGVYSVSYVQEELQPSMMKYGPLGSTGFEKIKRLELLKKMLAARENGRRRRR